MQDLIGYTTRQLNSLITARTPVIATIKAPEGHQIETTVVRVRWHKGEYQCMTRDGVWHPMIKVREG